MSKPNRDDLLLNKQICFSLYSATNAMTRAYRPLLNQLDLTYSQYLAMLVLWEQNGINVKALGHQLHLDSGTLTPLLKRIETKGLVERRRCDHDERARVLFLTSAGKALKQQAESIPSEMMCKSKLSVEELTQLKATCDKLFEQLTK
ncbi:MarR family transcriptional regulator [Photobacterium jeanii]|uniref:MarR family transcriptional regulator n=1 Tax=Photobacterium jeanii TaxID=858640 RepID=A0A178K1A7_9GAMM|nr:MarR family transcriptional regulator [Photobacterium jeanii]OAN11090.1 MarR family transcriptional regulator [Photobacterium jeanii]PST90604.1 MarR family transcriptional regulator [Photobacterium jeanii]